jgi:glycosyltransferase involved in cell wall biosynthesis
LLEAMACQCAIVGSNTGPVREVIKDGSTGLLTDFFNPTELAQKVGRLLGNHDLATTLGKQARELIEKKYDLNHCLPQQLALIELVANGTLSA